MLVFNLDEKESKLRQLMGLMKDQEEQWNRSVSDLKVGGWVGGLLTGGFAQHTDKCV